MRPVITLITLAVLLPCCEPRRPAAQNAIDACSVAFSAKPDVTKTEASAEMKVFLKCVKNRGYDFRPDECRPVTVEGAKFWQAECYRSRQSDRASN